MEIGDKIKIVNNRPTFENFHDENIFENMIFKVEEIILKAGQEPQVSFYDSHGNLYTVFKRFCEVLK